MIKFSILINRHGVITDACLAWQTDEDKPLKATDLDFITPDLATFLHLNLSLHLVRWAVDDLYREMTLVYYLA